MDILGRPFNRVDTIAMWSRAFMRVPPRPGVYAIYRSDHTPPSFLAKSPAGWWKRQDPTIGGGRLSTRWVPGAGVLYVGAAEDLRDRIDLLVSFGSGNPVLHKGGRALWQVEGITQAEIFWSEVVDDCERCVENELLRDFHSKHGCFPFANLAGPRRHLKCKRKTL